MEHLLPLLALLACPIGMGLMMLFMGRGMASSKAKDPRRPPEARSLAELKREQARLRDQIEGVERRDRHQPSASRAASEA